MEYLRSEVPCLSSHENKNTDSEATEVNEEEPQAHVGATDVMETFKVCHTSCKKVMSDAATEAILSMENGQLPLPSDEVVSKVPSQNSSNNTFLKNVDISTPSSKSPSSASEKVLRRELDSGKQGSTILHDKLEELKKKNEATEEALERTSRQYDELKSTRKRAISSFGQS
ncbi:uncharacterized protein LOC120663319 [Panicum virgatum]|uniref:Uncharacterized protein n=1 Tax=Panicum virgatum TaxID=38727 RepID=A0A8T0UEQ9_PANVG|nr:uncharacterized protein LOC120663319 [Panicum virgatum]KAG2620445.1 hypothetical protein PVAP13_3NG107400 [Panicum virgatum]